MIQFTEDDLVHVEKISFPTKENGALAVEWNKIFR